MFGKRINLFKLLGFQVRIDMSWIILALLIAWSLSSGLFPFYYKDLSTSTYWIMGIIGTVGLFISIVFHEFCHSVVARRYGVPMKGITLFIFGGMAEMSEEPTSAKAEFMMAVAGPVSSVVAGLAFYALLGFAKQAGWISPVRGVLAYLAWINMILAGFNLLPAFPLDGGRVLRSILWAVKKNLRWASRISSRIGSLFGFVMILFGFLNFFRGNFIGGLWWFLIGMFLHSAARMSYQQLLTRKALEGETVRRFMKEDPVTVPSSATVGQLVEDYIYRYHFKMFPVVESAGRLLGCVTTKDVKAVPKEEWGKRSVGEIAASCTEANTIRSGEDAVKALSRMSQNNMSRLMVIDDDHLAGVITLKDMLKFLSLKVELEDQEHRHERDLR
jgi:Zn-dependent protease/CBS domain-containing protein